MKLFLRLSPFVLLLCFSAAKSFAQKVVPELWGQRVHDEAHVLTQSTADQLEKDLKVYEDSTSNQIAILIVQSLDGDVLEQYSLRVAEKWKLGQKDKDNGVLLLIAIDDHKMRIEVGQGLEGVLTDALCNRIIRNEIAPAFRRNDYDGGVISAIKGIIKAIGGEYTVEEPDTTNELTTTGKILFGLFIFGILGIFTMITAFVQGCAGWGMYAFLIPFYAVFGWIPFDSVPVGLGITGTYIVAMAIFKLILANSVWGKKLMKKWGSSSKKKWSSGSGGGSSWSSSSSSSSDSSWSSSSDSGSSFSGGGGDFGGGGSSGSW